MDTAHTSSVVWQGCSKMPAPLRCFTSLLVAPPESLLFIDCLGEFENLMGNKVHIVIIFTRQMFMIIWIQNYPCTQGSTSVSPVTVQRRRSVLSPKNMSWKIGRAVASYRRYIPSAGMDTDCTRNRAVRITSNTASFRWCFGFWEKSWKKIVDDFSSQKKIIKKSSTIFFCLKKIVKKIYMQFFSQMH